MKHTVVLYNPASVFYTMPLGLLAIGSALDPEKYRVVVIDARLERDPPGAVLEQARGALCLGMSVLTGRPIRDALKVSRAVRARFPDLPIIWGGWHPSLFQKACLEESAVDITVAGQGEETFRELVGRLAGGESLEGCEGAAFRRGNDIVVNAPRAMKPMETFPAHDYGLIPVERYFRLKKKRQLDYISSQGCRFRCAFCADPQVYNRGWTGLSPERMGKEIGELYHRYRFEELAFQDETFFTRPDRVEAICDIFLAGRFSFTWTATMRADQGARLPDEAFAAARRSGLRWAMIGVESGSQVTLDRIKKDITIEQVLISAEKCLRHDVGAIFPFIVGFPGETPESVEATRQLVKRLLRMSPRFEAPLFFYRPYPGSPVAQEAERAGYRMPSGLEEWADFDFVETDGADNRWMSEKERRMIERFRFYQRHAFGFHPGLLHRPLQKLARWRCDRDNYSLPLEKALIERFFPSPRLS